MLQPLKDRPAARAKLVAGRLCLDFANSVGGWRSLGSPPGTSAAREDRLNEYADLLAWALHSGVLDEAAAVRLWREGERRPREAAAVRDRARRLRDALHVIARCCEQGQPPRPADLQALADEVGRARERQRLEPEGGRLAWKLERPGRELDAPLWAVALSAESYFTSADLTRLRSCPSDDCGWHFEDTSRNRSRQWCDMADCGNAEKVRRFRSRQRRAAR